MTGTVLLILRALLAVLLYAFLSWALYTLWRDLRRQAEMQTARQVRPLTLTFEGIAQGLHFTQLDKVNSHLFNFFLPFDISLVFNFSFCPVLFIK